MRAVAEQVRLVPVLPLVEVVPELVMHDLKFFSGNVDAHLQPQVFVVIDIPGARVADHFPIPGFGELRAFPKRRREGGEAEGYKESLGDSNHLGGVNSVLLEDAREVIDGRKVARGDQRKDVGPRLRPHIS